jgi:hypothetical protein
MDAVGMRSVKHFEQRRCEVEAAPRKEVGWVGGEEEGEELVDAEIVELRRRRRNGMLGKR